MMRNRDKKDINGQSVVEYTLVVGAIVLVMFAMSTMVKRGAQSIMKTAADQVGVQQNSEQRFDDRGHLVRSFTATRTDSDKSVSEFGRNTTYTKTESIHTDGSTLINLGFSEEFK